MQIVIPDALPPTPVAPSLEPYIAQCAPKLIQWFSRCSANIQRVNLLETACTTPEFWTLTQTRTFTPAKNQNVSSGLGPLLEPDTQQPDKPVWIAELVHVSPSRDGAGLLPASQLGISTQESVSLFESAHEIFSHYGFALQAGRHPERWLVTPPINVSPASVSPTLVAHTRVNDWWPQDAATRPWRQLVNELQMAWHNHPVNQARNATGRAAINSLWLFGGACTGQLSTTNETPATQWFNKLTESFQAADWGQWLEAFQGLESAVLNTLHENNATPTELVLMGEDRIVTLKPTLLMRLRAQLPGQATHWRNWWSPRS